MHDTLVPYWPLLIGISSNAFTLSLWLLYIIIKYIGASLEITFET